MYGWGFCEQCRAGYAKEKDIPGCETEGYCNTIKGNPHYLDPGNRFAWELHSEVVDISVIDANGLPTLSMLGFILDYRDYEFRDDEFDWLLLQLRNIHTAYRDWKWSKIKPPDK